MIFSLFMQIFVWLIWCYAVIQLLEYAILSIRDKKSGPPLFSNSPVVWDDQRLIKLTDT